MFTQDYPGLQGLGMRFFIAYCAGCARRFAPACHPRLGKEHSPAALWQASLIEDDRAQWRTG
jgi:hypothetical protein